ncbi:MAG: transglutaminase-like domain-containing protein [Acidimicrobiales bacterium]|jgi:transglutaminase-like putative cysteine protease
MGETVVVQDEWLASTWFIDAESSAVDRFSAKAVDGVTDPTEMAIRLFHAVRDGIRYDPYNSDPSPESYRASAIADLDSSWCVPKSVLLVAAARNRGIPARLGFADVRNHLTSEKLSEQMGTDLFIWHGYAQLLLGNRWFKLSSAFNIELCERFGVKVLEFDGTSDALMHPFDEAGNRHMEYVNERGDFDDLPLDQIQSDFREVYPHWQDPDETPSSAAAAGDTAFDG